jgi:hypothetical protein
VTGHGLAHPRRAPLTSRQLHGAVAIAVGVLELGDAVWRNFDDGDGDAGAILVEDTRHPGLPPDHSDGHLRFLNSVVRPADERATSILNAAGLNPI